MSKVYLFGLPEVELDELVGRIFGLDQEFRKFIMSFIFKKCAHCKGQHYGEMMGKCTKSTSTGTEVIDQCIFCRLFYDPILFDRINRSIRETQHDYPFMTFINIELPTSPSLSFPRDPDECSHDKFPCDKDECGIWEGEFNWMVSCFKDSLARFQVGWGSLLDDTCICGIRLDGTLFRKTPSGKRLRDSHNFKEIYFKERDIRRNGEGEKYYYSKVFGYFFKHSENAFTLRNTQSTLLIIETK
jgi:hypothetical protein